MTNQLQIKATLLDIETKSDKNQNPYYRLSLFNCPNRYFYAFSKDFNLNPQTLAQLRESPHQLVNQLVLITYEEVPNQNQGVFCKIRHLELV